MMHGTGIIVIVALLTAGAAAADTPELLLTDSCAGRPEFICPVEGAEVTAGFGYNELRRSRPVSMDGSCLAPPSPPDTAQLAALDRYLRWRDAVPEASEAQINPAGLRSLCYLVEGARMPRIQGGGVHYMRIEIIQFPTEEAAKEFDPLTQTQLGHHPTDLNGPGELERYLALHTQTLRSGNLVMFMDIGSDARMGPDDYAHMRRVKERLVAAFTDDWQSYPVAVEEAECNRQFADWTSRWYRFEENHEFAVGDCARWPRRQRDEARPQMQEMLAWHREAITRLEVALDALNADEPWLVRLATRGMDAVRLLTARADSPAYMADWRAIEIAAVDALYAVADSADVAAGSEEGAITDMLVASVEDGLLKEQCDLLGLRDTPRFLDIRRYGNYAGVTVRASEREDAEAAAGRREVRRFRPDSVMPTLRPGWALALYLRKTEAGWVIRKGIPRHEAPWR